jgi:hypothetical protein
VFFIVSLLVTRIGDVILPVLYNAHLMGMIVSKDDIHQVFTDAGLNLRFKLSTQEDFSLYDLVQLCPTSCSSSIYLSLETGFYRDNDSLEKLTEWLKAANCELEIELPEPDNATTKVVLGLLALNLRPLTSCTVSLTGDQLVDERDIMQIANVLVQLDYLLDFSLYIEGQISKDSLLNLGRAIAQNRSLRCFTIVVMLPLEDVHPEEFVVLLEDNPVLTNLSITFGEEQPGYDVHNFKHPWECVNLFNDPASHLKRVLGRLLIFISTFT